MPPECAIIGAGPAGFYAAEALLETNPDVRVTIIDRLPAAFGLARYGVAPDHLRLKSVCKVFESIARDQRVRFIGNVPVPEAVPLGFLIHHFGAVVLATGAPQARALSIPGESLAGSYSSAEIVGWYNGHPQYADLDPDLGSETAVVVGQGNVALDIARILLTSQDRLWASDIAEHALEQLARSRIRTVHVIGRRNHWETKFSVKELRELEKTDDVSLHVADFAEPLRPPRAQSVACTAADGEAVQAGQFFRRLANRNANDLAPTDRIVRFLFNLTPLGLLGARAVQAAEFAVNNVIASAPVQRRSIACGLFVRSIGSQSAEVCGLPRDGRRGCVANDQGQVLDEAGRAIPKLYVTGWARRGAVGVIGTNREDGALIAQRVNAQLASSASRRQGTLGGHQTLMANLVQSRRAVIDQHDWFRIDAAEVKAGFEGGRPRVKFVTVADLLTAAVMAEPTT